jgi:hypothetical protein
MREPFKIMTTAWDHTADFRCLTESLAIAVCCLAWVGPACGADPAPADHRHEAKLSGTMSTNSLYTELAAKSTSAQNGKVIGLDLLSSHYFSMWQMWTRAGQKKNADEAMEQMLKHMKANPHLVRMGMQSLPKDHAQYHPHMTKECALIEGLKPNDKFDAAGHAKAIISESLACPICNPPPPDDTPKPSPSPGPRPRPTDPPPAKPKPGGGTKPPEDARPRDAARAREALRHAAGMNGLPPGMDARFFDSLSDAEAMAFAELWTDYAAPGGRKARELALGKQVAEAAESMKDSTAYASPQDEARYPYTCNRFVHDVLVAVGLPLPLRERWGGLLQSRYPLLAGDYADPLREIPGLPVVHGLPRPGDVIAMPLDSPRASGHVGIVVAYDPVTGQGRTVSVSSSTRPFTVKESDFGFRPRDREQPIVIRRPTWTERGK